MRREHYTILLMLYLLSTSATPAMDVKSTEVLDSMIRCFNELLAAEGTLQVEDIAAMNAGLTELRRASISLPGTADFVPLRGRVYEVAELVERLYTKRISALSDHHFAIDFYATCVFLLGGQQKHMRAAYERFSWEDQLRFMLPYQQSKVESNYIAANLFILAARHLQRSDDTVGRMKSWDMLARIFEGIDLELFDICKILDVQYLCTLLERLISVIDGLKNVWEGDTIDGKLSQNSMKKITAAVPELTIRLEAAKNIQRVSEISDPWYWYCKAEKGDDDSTRVLFYTRAIALNPAWVEALINRGNSYQRLGMFVEAITDYSRASELESDNAIAYHNLGTVYLQLGRYEEAIERYSIALHYDSICAPTYVNRGNAWRMMGEYDRALRDYNKAIELNPESAMAFNNRGIALRYLGKYDEAIEDYARAIALAPEYENAYFNLGCIYWLLADYKAAAASWQRCYEVNPGNEKVREWLGRARTAEIGISKRGEL